MNARYKSNKEPIELLLGMGGAVQYLEHTLKDESTYLVLVKTKTGTKQLTIPIEAVQSIYTKKPAEAVIDSIKKQLLSDSSDSGSTFATTKEPQQPNDGRWGWLLKAFNRRK